jgi:hypothetical protein
MFALDKGHPLQKGDQTLWLMKLSTCVKLRNRTDLKQCRNYVPVLVRIQQFFYRKWWVQLELTSELTRLNAKQARLELEKQKDVTYKTDQFY